VSDHLPRRLLLDYLEDAEDVDRQPVEAHLTSCAVCRDVRDELQSLIFLLGDGAVFRHIDEDSDADQRRTWNDLVAEIEHVERSVGAADTFYLQLAEQPVESWAKVIATHPEACTTALVQRLVEASAPELDRNPEYALRILHIAELVAFALHDGASRRSLGQVWKQRSNALRMLARYEDAIDAAIMAEHFYASLRDPDSAYEIAQARYTLAVTLFKMTRYPAALQVLARARGVLEEYGTTAPLAKAMMLDALIRIEQGEVAAARDTLRALLLMEERLEQHLEAARVRTNLAECNLRLGDLDAAMEDARAAIEAFRVLGNVAEETRSEWTLAMVRLARGEADALSRLYEIAAVYTELGMPAEAGFVHLDVTEELLRREEWTEAELVARDLVILFSAAGVTLASVNALDHLRRAVEHRTATGATVRYVRTYVAQDDPAQRFEPPREAVQ
jgi:tetratricopeptide (TPR) repeat protein